MGYKLSKQRLKNLRSFANKFYDSHFSEVNANWKAEWKYVIQREYPWNGVFDIILYKIRTMKEYMEALRNDEFGFKYRITNESIDKQLIQMNEVLDLGQKIYDDNYLQKASDWYDENNTYTLKIYQITEITKAYAGIPANYLPEGFEVIGEFETKDRFNFLGFSFDDTYEGMTVQKWCQEHNMKKSEIGSVVITTWNNGKSDKENTATWRKMMTDAAKERKSDIKKFYSLLAKYEDSWGD